MVTPVVAAPLAQAGAGSEGATPPGLEAFRQFPGHAAVYAAITVNRLDEVLPRTPKGESLLYKLSALLEIEAPIPEVFEKSGVDPSRPLLLAVVPAAEPKARQAVEAMTRDVSGKVLDEVFREHATDATLVRVVVPLLDDVEPRRAAASLIQAFSRGGAFQACPAAKGCKAFGKDPPLGLMEAKDVAVAAYADGSDLRMDLAFPLFVPGNHGAAVQALMAFRGAAGGVRDRCTALDPVAGLSICMDPDRVAELGTTTGYGATARALSSGAVDATMRRQIAALGQAEAQQNLWLSAPAHRVATDGTFTIQGPPADSRVSSSWKIADASQGAVAQAFTSERCAEGEAVQSELLPALLKVFGDLEPAASERDKVLVAFREAGLGAYLTLLAGAWPNLLGTEVTRVQAISAMLGSIQVCARYESGRLSLEVPLARPSRAAGK
ncbi:hypothetical protein [Chondromyces crocatus]|uniref:Uncharacterized protein n=1 Tax=Chondromyces crocatus TaxID=52 RepID=A0A0K1EQD8_CHOCO|nr:hypothetical protein [Chondromyces crocatus]AKT42872.1 uncharacterized protein CMC5_071000 [Chondromyces crocatus]